METTKEEIQFDEFSEHLFWDVDIKNLKSQKNKKQIIRRVLDYGLMNDWKIILKYYGINIIAETAKGIRDLSKKSASFIMTLTDSKKEEFACYSQRHLMNEHWNF